MNACAFTGHRPARFSFRYNENHPLCLKIKEAILSECRRLYETENVRTFYTGCALGVDLWGAEAALHLRGSDCPDIRLICAVPFPNHTEKWPGEQIERLKRIYKAVGKENIIITCDSYSSDTYKIRNYFMVDRAQYLLAVFDGEKNMRSGTLQTVNYARKKECKISLIHPDTAAVIIE